MKGKNTSMDSKNSTKKFQMIVQFNIHVPEKQNQSTEKKNTNSRDKTYENCIQYNETI